LPPRQCWIFKQADWTGINNHFNNTGWATIFSGSDSASMADTFSEFSLEAARSHIPFKTVRIQKATHPWLNDRCSELVTGKHAAEGTDNYETKQEECTIGLHEEYCKYVASR
jgi:hypothetical protein